MLLVWKSLYDGTHSIWGNGFGLVWGGYSQPPPPLQGTLVQLLAHGVSREQGQSQAWGKGLTGGQAWAAATMFVALPGAGRAWAGRRHRSPRVGARHHIPVRPVQTEIEKGAPSVAFCGIQPLRAAGQVGTTCQTNKQQGKQKTRQTNKQKGKQTKKKPTNK